jgi:hypothetical protein
MYRELVSHSGLSGWGTAKCADYLLSVGRVGYPCDAFRQSGLIFRKRNCRKQSQRTAHREQEFAAACSLVFHRCRQYFPPWSRPGHPLAIEVSTEGARLRRTLER